MDASELIADYYATVVQRCDSSGRPNALPHHDRVIYYIVSTRCEMDMNGFESVFDQFLTEEELLFLIQSLRELGAMKLAESFTRAHARLNSAGFFNGEPMMIGELDEGESGAGFLDDIEAELREQEELWDLDARLVALIPADDSSDHLDSHRSS